MLNFAIISKRVNSIAPVAIKGTWVRIVPLLHLTTKDPPDWLFTSGKPNRYNPSDVHCIYFADGEQTAKAEYDDYWGGGISKNQPKATYFAKVRLRRVLDLTLSKTVAALGIKQDDLFVSWRRSKTLVLPQLIGKAVSESGTFSAIVYHSKAAQKAGHSGRNIVLFRTQVTAPESVHILGPDKRPLQTWP
jgi:RES domain-containing protein